MPNQALPASIMKDPVTWLYPPIEPYNVGKLRVSPLHEIYFEESGNPAGKPVIFLHGGSDPKQHRFRPPQLPHADPGPLKGLVEITDPKSAC